MAISGIEIFKKLPQTNCGDCGNPTCLAFAMNTAVGKKEYTECPHLSEETKKFLDEALTPPIKTIKLKLDNAEIKIGGETVLYRHEKRFENPTLIGLEINDNDNNIDEKLNSFTEASFNRIENILKPEIICVNYVSCDVTRYLNICHKVINNTNSIMIIKNFNNIEIESILERANNSVIIFNKEYSKEVLECAKKYHTPIVVNDVNKNYETDVILNNTSHTLKEMLQKNVNARREALNNHNKLYGKPTLIDLYELNNASSEEKALAASLLMNKYTSIILLNDISPEFLKPLLIQRMNIYSDPQRPHMTKEGIYEIGKPDSNSPILITTNFALTYFIVSSEIESAKLDTYLIIQNTDGLSVMTAWAAGKFNADNIAELINKCGISEKTSRKELILPGYLSMEKDELSKLLPEWKITIGPREINQIKQFLNN